jgi:hypothetical protein
MTVVTIKKAKQKSYTWAVQHLTGRHPGQFEIFVGTNQTTFVSEDAASTYAWIDWITSENQELTFVQKHRV